MTRRRPQLAPTPEEPRPWLVRLADGQILGPLTAEQLASLVDVGTVTATTEITPAAAQTWQPLGALPEWQTLKPTRKPFALRGTGDPPVIRPPTATSASPGAPGLTAEASTAMDRARAYRAREEARLTRQVSIRDAGRLLEVVGLSATVGGCVCLGDILLFGLRPIWGSAFMLLGLVALSRVMALWFVWRILR